MIYIKIYLDKDENGEDMLVFDSVKRDDEKAFFTVAGKKEPFLFYDEPIPHFENKTKVIGVEQVAISPEAKAFFLELLNDESTHTQMPYRQNGNFEMSGCYRTQYGWDSGQFSFRPPQIDEGNTKKTLRRGEHFTVDCFFSKEPLEYMTLCLNEDLQNLDLSSPADEAPLLDSYYTTMREKGEELSCDVDTIRRTPVRYLTDEQKDVIKKDYRERINRYDSQEWHDHGDFLDDKIIGELLEKYLKFVDIN